MRLICFITIMFLSGQLYAQSIFEETLKGKSQGYNESTLKTFELNGYARSVVFGGKVHKKNKAEIKSVYGEASLKLRVPKKGFGSGFAEIRFRKGNEFNEYVSELNLREAFVNTYVGSFDFSIGHQIIAWGRADGINPTDNISPKNMIIRSLDEDDKKEGNFLIRVDKGWSF